MQNIRAPKQMLQRLPVPLAQVKASNTSENLLNEIRPIQYSLNQAKQITKDYITMIMYKKVYIINSIKL